ncbi:MAG: methyltransferase domain-containing protein [Chitinophagaceae bacterium]|nr:MAG: methyltransferase domain-containing protein [Chitinophagaceae bacterium]
MKIDTGKRSTSSELMDDFSMQGPVLTDALDKIAAVNRFLGGNRVTLQGIAALLGDPAPGGVLRIVDVGCGNGDMLRTLARHPAFESLELELIGIDANQASVDHARTLSAGFSNISYRCMDIFEPLEPGWTCDIMLFTLTLHHFSDRELTGLLSRMKKHVRRGIVVNDLQRSAIAYRLFQALSFVFGLSDMSREDGLVSILRGFKKKDLLAYEKQLGKISGNIKWRWAFRYLWIISI